MYRRKAVGQLSQYMNIIYKRKYSHKHTHTHQSLNINNNCFVCIPRAQLRKSNELTLMERGTKRRDEKKRKEIKRENKNSIEHKNTSNTNTSGSNIPRNEARSNAVHTSNLASNINTHIIFTQWILSVNTFDCRSTVGVVVVGVLFLFFFHSGDSLLHR